jgi:5-methylcytosine-specific restriction endonuclease McrA
MKTCKKCGKTKPLSGYAKGKKNADGHKPVCLACDRIYQAKYRLENTEKRKALQDLFLSKNKEEQRLYKQAWYQENKQRVSALHFLWKSKNPESARIYGENRRARKSSSGGKLTLGLSSKLFLLQKGRCACCKKPLGGDYHMDHIMPLALGGTNTDDNIQLLTSKCNRQKQAKHPVDFMRQRGFLL